MSESETSDQGALDVESAISLLNDQGGEEDNPSPQAEQPDVETQEIEADASSADDETDQPEKQDGEVEEEAEQAETLLEPPLYWKPEAKEAFAKLDPALQAEILAQEGPREEAASKAKAEAKAQVEAAQKEVESIQKLAAHLNDFLPQALQTFQSRWGQGEPDWAAVAEEHGTDKAFQLKTQYDRETAQLKQLQETAQKTAQEAHTAFVQSEWKVLAEIAPELAPDVSDVAKGHDKREGVTKYLVNQGVPVEAIKNISAREMLIAHKAMLWDQAQTALKAKPAAPKPAAPPPKAIARPSAGQTHVPPKVAALKAADRALSKSGSIEDAVALLNLRQ